MDESIIVASIVDKLSPSRKDTKRTLKHKKVEISLEYLTNHLCIGEELHQGQKRNKKRPNKDNNTKGKKKAKVVCWECNKPGYKKRDCPI